MDPMGYIAALRMLVQNIGKFHVEVGYSDEGHDMNGRHL